jgi:ElaB/YqjD/DUF883 family membrane-anchored ribosome-binding protein
MGTVAVSRDKLVADMRVVTADAEELVRATAGQAAGRIAAARARVQDGVTAMKATLEQLAGAGTGRARAAARATDEYVRGRPWRAVGIAALVGVVVGGLILRR